MRSLFVKKNWMAGLAVAAAFLLGASSASALALSLAASIIPEPGTALLMGLGLMGLGVSGSTARRRRFARSAGDSISLSSALDGPC